MPAVSELTIRSAQNTVEEMTKLRMLIAKAFHNDPFCMWLFADVQYREHIEPAFFGLLIEQHFATGRIDVCEVDGRTVATAIWTTSDDQPSSTELFPTPAGLLQAIVGAVKAAHAIDAYGQMSNLRPSTAYLYLRYLAVDPDYQGTGIGRKTLARGIETADALGEPIYLETNNPRGLALYQSRGFIVRDRCELPHGGPELWTMYRPPTSTGSSALK